MLNRYFAAAFLWTVFVTALCLVSTSSLKDIDVIELSGKDKIAHMFFYFVFTITWFLFFKSRYGDNATVRSSVFLIATAYGGLIEIIQYLFTSERSADIMDALANSAGSGLAVLIIWLYKKIQY